MADRRLAEALVAVIVRYLTTIQPHAHRELARWRRRALTIPDPELRAHVLRPYETDSSAIGAAIFAVLAPWRRQRQLVRLLIAYVLLWSYVDVRTERDPGADPRLYDALVAALHNVPYEAWTQGMDDADYVRALLVECRRGVGALPSWNDVAPTALSLADDGRVVQAINHGPAAAAAIRLRAWGHARTPDFWREACAAASSPLAIHALMALAGREGADWRAACATAAAYGPVSALAVLCDHLIDGAEDHAFANHSYLPHLGSPSIRPDTARDLADRAARAVRTLPDSPRHIVIVAAMAAMFLSRRQALARANDAISAAILDGVGPPATQLHAALLIRR